MARMLKGLDMDAEPEDTESRQERRLVVKATYPHRMVCKGCGSLLFRSRTALEKAGIEIKCRKCGTVSEL